MKSIPLPSRIHYELLLQLLERETSLATNQQPDVKAQVRQLIITLRKALAQQKQIESSLEQTGLEYEYRWSLNSTALPRLSSLGSDGQKPPEDPHNS